MKYLPAIIVVFLMGAATPAAPQGVVGHLYDFDTGVIVSTAEVVMTNEAGDTVGRAISNQEGRFVILVEFPGDYSLSVTRLGYASQVSTGIRLEDGKLQDVEITVHGDAVALEGLVVSTTPRVKALNVMGFYERKKLHDRGNFVLPTEIEKMHAFSTSGLLRSVPGIIVRDGEVRTMRRATMRERPGEPGLRQEHCLMKVLVNGIDRGINLDEAIRRYEVSAIEVYNSISAVPPQYLSAASQGYVRFPPFGGEPIFERTCGAVLVWTVFGG